MINRTPARDRPGALGWREILLPPRENSPVEGRRFTLGPSREGVTNLLADQKGPEVDYDGLVGPVLLRGDREFESPSLRRGVYCEPGRAGGCRPAINPSS